MKRCMPFVSLIIFTACSPMFGSSGPKPELEVETQPSQPPQIEDESYMDFLKPENDIEEGKEEAKED